MFIALQVHGIIMAVNSKGGDEHVAASAEMVQTKARFRRRVEEASLETAQARQTGTSPFPSPAVFGT